MGWIGTVWAIVGPILGAVVGFLAKDRLTRPKLQARLVGVEQRGVFNVSVSNGGRATTLDRYWLEGPDGDKLPDGILSLFPFQGEWHQVVHEGNVAAERHPGLPREESVVIAFLARGELGRALEWGGGQLFLRMEPSAGVGARVDVTEALD